METGKWRIEAIGSAQLREDEEAEACGGFGVDRLVGYKVTVGLGVFGADCLVDSGMATEGSGVGIELLSGGID